MAEEKRFSREQNSVSTVSRIEAVASGFVGEGGGVARSVFSRRVPAFYPLPAFICQSTVTRNFKVLPIGIVGSGRLCSEGLCITS